MGGTTENAPAVRKHPGAGNRRTVLMQDQTNPVDGSHEGNPSGLGVTRCDQCGAPERPLDHEGLCPMCQKLRAHVRFEAAEVSLEILSATLRVALEGNADPEDIRALVEDELRGASSLMGGTQKELHQKIDELYLAGVR